MYGSQLGYGSFNILWIVWCFSGCDSQVWQCILVWGLELPARAPPQCSGGQGDPNAGCSQHTPLWGAVGGWSALQVHHRGSVLSPGYASLPLSKTSTPQRVSAFPWLCLIAPQLDKYTTEGQCFPLDMPHCPSVRQVHHRGSVLSPGYASLPLSKTSTPQRVSAFPWLCLIAPQ